MVSPGPDGFVPGGNGPEAQYNIADDEDRAEVDGKEDGHQQQTGCVEESVEEIAREDETAEIGKELQEASTHLPRYVMHSIPISSHEADFLELVDMIDCQTGT